VNDSRTRAASRTDSGSDATLTGVAGLTVGVPTEVKNNENRVALTPDGVRELVQHGVPVLVQAGAGEQSTIADGDYERAGARIVPDAATVFEQADLICKVKEPQPEELAMLRRGQVLFTYLHLAAYPAVGHALLAGGVTGVAYETVQLPNGELPLLAPMSEVAGRMATQVGAHFLEREAGGRGVLLGGVPGVRPARVVVVGAGNVGWNAAWIAAGMEAEVVLLDKNVDRLRWVDQIHRGRILTLASNRGSVERSVADADLVIGAVLVPGGRAPTVVTDDMIRNMKPRAVVVDVAIDQGGCVEGIHETTHDDPIFERHGVVHYAVGNMPGAVPHTSTYALTNATLPYLRELATKGLRDAVEADPALALGVNTLAGTVTHEAVAASLDTEHTPLDEALAKG
jgi:alanine dehydrogenase